MAIYEEFKVSLRTLSLERQRYLQGIGVEPGLSRQD